ncbi:MAG: F0F1 ATP synthase subunit epsilon [Deltaproteobacteria bacterium ADurb.BinA179]|jgi:F-type H+-transporting ATPase subunit epsilon|nr:F0F1 ATP synthase subunit epsilon [Deltaproteobacteria bacterium]MDI9542318.1 F0F1 ATP synthase subunit epsilon [Pseudomonadota bacterium]OPZ30279.1 MAG: F0F1 ATP synthase subunit epsilon [Deltaproteobacteria bacterium ADurb.BinA179]HNR51368.1 F0F1 ATP synthase subunit epsilon [Deltaproteobacteria bacterium]HNU75418.1 F0F1 ATP synthase subunit epsilon [Deltaproteobacteria bacterium]
MNFKILLPYEVFVHRDVDKVKAEAINGSFCLLPRHIDFVAALVPGLLSVQKSGSPEEYYATDEGVIVKKGDEVLVSTRNAVIIPDLGRLEGLVEEQFKTIDDREKKARTAAARLEADIVRRFMEIGKHG